MTAFNLPARNNRTKRRVNKGSLRGCISGLMCVGTTVKCSNVEAKERAIERAKERVENLFEVFESG